MTLRGRLLPLTLGTFGLVAIGLTAHCGATSGSSGPPDSTNHNMTSDPHGLATGPGTALVTDAGADAAAHP